MKTMTICILSKKERERILGLLDKLQALLPSEEQRLQVPQIVASFCQ